MDPDWLGSPQHFAVALILAAAVAFVAVRRWNCIWWMAGALGLGITGVAEVAFELVEYPLHYADDVNVTAYQDTLADLANSLAGGLVGAAIGVWLGNRR